jgi:C-terminal processing protease CtpA/Prc
VRPLTAQTAGPDRFVVTDSSGIVERLVSLADLYTAVYYFHPDVAGSDSARAAWDEAVAGTIESVADGSGASFRSRVGELLETLKDPDTGLAGPAPTGRRPVPQQVLRYTGHPPDVVNFYTGSFQPFVREWLERPASAPLRHDVHLADGVHTRVRYSRPADDGSSVSAQPVTTTTLPASSLYPRPGMRVIAAYRARAVIRYFYPYADHIHEDWGDVLRTSIPQLLNAGDSVAYALAVAGMLRHFHDSHVVLSGGAWDTFANVAKAPVGLRVIDDEMVVTGFASDSIRRMTGLTAGDVVLAVNDRSVEQERARLSQVTSASTPQGLDDAVALQLLAPVSGADHVRMRVQSVSGAVRDVAVATTDNWWLAFRARRGTPVYTRLAPDIGYIDLTRLRVQQVDSAFTALQDTRAIILDLRGYPQGTAWTIAPKLSRRDSLVMATSWTRVAPSPDTTAAEVVTEHTYVPYDADAERYDGQTVLLIDERSGSQSEYTAMMFRAANGTLLVGTPTMGANGDVTDFALPGNLRVSFTGTGIRFPDDAQLQRRGIQPDIYIAPTLRGIRAGRDEVLEHALKYLRGELPVVPAGTDPRMSPVP